MHVKRRRALDDDLHCQHLSDAMDTKRRREGPRRSSILKIVLKATVRNSGQGPRAKLADGLNTRHSGAASPSGDRIIADFHPTGTDNSAERN